MRRQYVHGNLLENKSSSSEDLAKAYDNYKKYIATISKYSIGLENLSKIVDDFNQYRKENIIIFENRNNSGQENLRSSMLEEFFCHLFEDLLKRKLTELPSNLILGKENSYVDLTFSPKDFTTLFEDPIPYFHTKDQDFIIGASFKVKIQTDEKEIVQDIVIPVIAIECKTYIERNMLDSCAGTARRIKGAMPYCIYIIAAEYMKMKDASPELSDINEVYILCKSSNSERLKLRKENKAPKDIDIELVKDLYIKVKTHLNSIWWSPEDALVTGKIINRP